MKIGIDCTTILNSKKGQYAGIAHYTYYFIKNVIKLDDKNNYVLFFYDNDFSTKDFEKENVRIVNMPLSRYKKFLPFVYRHVIVPIVYSRYKLDLLHFPAPIVPIFFNQKFIVTVHDLAIFKNPKWFPKMSYFFTNIIIPRSIKNAEKIIAVSQNTKNTIIEKFNIDSEKIKIIYEGVEDYNNIEINLQEVKKNIQNLYPYFLYLGTIEPRKNINSLIYAYKKFINEFPESKIKLVVAGKLGWKYDKTLRLIRDKKLKGRLVYVGYVNYNEKVYLYKNAFALLYPSFFEGFGLQLIEAMNVGLPVVTSNEGAISEVVLDNAVLVNPYSRHSILSGLKEIYTNDNLREMLSKKGKGIAKGLTWEETAKNTILLYNEID